MARLIDADALNQKCIETKIVEVFPYWKQLPFNVKSAMIEYAQAVKDIIQNAPTVDAQPVHGRWVYHMHFEDESKRDDFDVVCSHCGDFLVSCYDAEEAEIFRRDYGWCPKCGAKMDGGEEHDGE